MLDPPHSLHEWTALQERVASPTVVPVLTTNLLCTASFVGVGVQQWTRPAPVRRIFWREQPCAQWLHPPQRQMDHEI